MPAAKSKSKSEKYDAGPTHVALLRGINVGGRALVAMAELTELFERLGLSPAATLLQSGNVVFRAGKQPTHELEQLLDEAVAKQFGRRADVLVRTAGEWGAAAANNPFADEAKRDPSHLLVMFLKTPVTGAQVEALRATVRGPEVIRHRGRELYIAYPGGIGRSRLTGTAIESNLGVRGTGRNWNTVTKIAGRLGDGGGSNA